MPMSRHAFQLMTRVRPGDRKSTRLNSSHSQISYAVFCLKKKKNEQQADIRDIARPLSLEWAHTMQRLAWPPTPALLPTPSPAQCGRLAYLCGSALRALL